MRKIVVLEEAAEDIEQGRKFYDLQEIGVGDYFEDTILSDIESLGLFNGIHSKHFGFHRLLSERFPFGIYYRETPTATEVFAVLDLRKNPVWIHKKLKKGIKGLHYRNSEMNPPPKILDAEITTSQLKVKLDSGITVLMPLEHVPTLLLATEKERQDMEVFDHSLHWESLDCDLSVEGLMAGAKEMPNLARKALEKFFARQYGRIAA